MKTATIVSIVVLVLLCGLLVYWVYSGTTVDCCVNRKICNCEDGNLDNNWSCQEDPNGRCSGQGTYKL